MEPYFPGFRHGFLLAAVAVGSLPCPSFGGFSVPLSLSVGCLVLTLAHSLLSFLGLLPLGEGILPQPQ